MSKINARQKGHAYERKVAQEMRDLGFEKCLTSRLESKRMDDAGVDLCYTDPFYIQLKATENYPKFHHLLFEKMPQEDDKINVVMNKKNRKGEIVVMSKEDFYKIIELLNKATL